MSTSRVVAIGASVGGVEALRALAGALPRGFPAPILVVQHIGRHRSILPELIAAAGPLPARHAIDGEPLAPGHIHVAPPDRHLVVEGHRVRLFAGPREHHSRPAIDPLFRSLALSRGPDAVGVILTGRLDDGTAGLQAIRGCGGVGIVQDPAEAREPGMPASALRHADPDHCVPLSAIPGLLAKLAAVPAASRAQANIAGPWAVEERVSRAEGNPMQQLQSIAEPSTFTCPDCQGALWRIRDAAPPRYRCHTGHAFTLATLEHAQAEATEEALWSAVRALQEKKALLEQMAAEHRAEHGRELELLAEAARTGTMAAGIRETLEGRPTAPPGA